MLTARFLALTAGLMAFSAITAAQTQPGHEGHDHGPTPMKEVPAANQPHGTMEAIPLPAGSPLLFEKTLHDFGKIPDTTPVTYDFKFKNTSDQVVKIVKVTASCGCTTTKSKEVIQPGEESSITATFNPQGRSGREAKSITVELDHPTVRNIHLTAVAYVQKRVLIEPPALFMGEVPHGKGAKQEISISGRNADFKVTSARMENPHYTLEELGHDAVEVEGDTLQRYRYRITLKDTAPIGNQQASATFTTNDPQYPTTQVTAMAQVAGPIRVMPERLPVRYSGAGQAWVAEVNLEPRENRPFKVLSASVDPASAPMNVVIDVAPGRPGSKALYRVRVAGTTPGSLAEVRGNVVVKTDLPDQAEIVLPFLPLQVAAPAVPTAAPSLQGGAVIKPPTTGTLGPARPIERPVERPR